MLTTELEDLPRIIPGQVSSLMLRLKKAVWYYEKVTAQGTRLQNELYKLKREHKLTRDRQEKQFLAKIIKSREKQLTLIRKTKTVIEKELPELFPGHGLNLTSIRGIGVITAAKIVAHTSGIERFLVRRYCSACPKLRKESLFCQSKQR